MNPRQDSPEQINRALWIRVKREYFFEEASPQTKLFWWDFMFDLYLAHLCRHQLRILQRFIDKELK